METTRILILTLGLGAMIPAVAVAQQNVPRRDANTWNGLDHEPSPSNVEHKERAAGIAPGAAQQKALNNEVEQLDQQIRKDEQAQ